MLSVSGTTNQIPVKVKYLDEFIPLLKARNISYRFVGSLIGYFVYELQSEADKLRALKLRDTLYSTEAFSLDSGSRTKKEKNKEQRAKSKD